MRVLLDTDVILDVVLAREPFGSVSVQLFKLHDEGVIEGCVAAVTPVNVFYVVRKLKDMVVADRR
jgi:predicted nucleic acid-binding protein